MGDSRSCSLKVTGTHPLKEAQTDHQLNRKKLRNKPMLRHMRFHGHCDEYHRYEGNGRRDAGDDVKLRLKVSTATNSWETEG